MRVVSIGGDPMIDKTPRDGALEPIAIVTVIGAASSTRMRRRLLHPCRGRRFAGELAREVRALEFGGGVTPNLETRSGGRDPSLLAKPLGS